jgi:hypothetical protein
MLYVFVSHVLRSNLLGLEPLTEVCHQPNLPADKTPFKPLLIKRLREGIKVGHQRTFGFMQQDPQSLGNLIHLDSPLKERWFNEEKYYAD